PPPSALPRKRQVNAATTHRTPIVTFLSALTQAHRFRYRAFEWNGCLDPEDLTQEVFKRMIERVNEGAEIYSEPSGYAYGIAKRILKEQPKKRRTN
ncbi:MAG: hypothetical protein FJW39_25350, partial [Acidobacteria bacterium]|nr:hypothetical protein [Acidobacteriota bacterium]